MREYKANTDFLYENKLVIDHEIFELNGNPEEDEYLRLFKFYEGNLRYLENQFGCSPSYFYIRNENKINAKARKRKGSYLVGINHKVLYTLFTKYQAYFKVIEVKGLENYQSLQDILKDELHDLVYQAILHFNFYHEWAHLLQFKAEDENEVSYHENSDDYNKESHNAEIDADCVSCYSCAAHFYQYLQNHSIESPSREQTEVFISLFSAASIIYLCEFLEEFDRFYLREKKYPHPSIRVCNLSMEIPRYYSYLQKSKDVDLEKQIRVQKVGKETRRVCKILSKHFGLEDKYIRIQELIRSNTLEISKYLLEVKKNINENINSAVNQRNKSI